MKKLVFLILLANFQISFAQNVGIGTLSPQATLDVKGNVRTGGTSSYMRFDSLSGKIEWVNSNLYVPVTAALMKHSAAGDGLFYNNSGGVNGQLEYRNALGQPVFYTNFINSKGYFRGRLGIATIDPLAGLHVADSSVLFSAENDIPLTPPLPPKEGQGRRMMWFPAKAAFRVGYVSGTQWDQVNIGNYSFASGLDTKANGNYCTAMGYGTTASTGYTTALGFFSSATGLSSTAIGNQTTAKAFGGISVGTLNDFSDNPDPLNANPTDRIFQIGNGGGFFPGNAMTVLRNGNIGVGTLIPAFKLDVGSGSINTDSLYRIGTIPVLAAPAFNNLFVGLYAGRISYGGENTFIGQEVGFSNTSGNYNSFCGYRSGYQNTTGTYNAFFGGLSGYYNSTGAFNSFFGADAGYWNTSGNSNSFFGRAAGHANTTGSANSFFGNNAGVSTTSGINNSFFGESSGYFNTTGGQNSFYGRYAGYSNTTGQTNSFFGEEAGKNNTTGGSNSFFGEGAGYLNTTAGNNSYFGYSAGTLNTTGDFNAYFGRGSGFFNGTGSQNTAIGANSLYSNVIGWYNTAVGYNTGPSNDFFNTTTLGIDATAGGNDMVRIGNIYVGSIGGFQNWTNVSDGRFKQNIKEDVKGLDFIRKLRPVTYTLDVDAINQSLGIKDSTTHASAGGREAAISMIHSGFIAQEVESAARAIGYDFSGVDAPENSEDYYGLRYAEFVVPLVKAMQEQQEMIEKQNAIIDELKTTVEFLMKEIAAMKEK